MKWPVTLLIQAPQRCFGRLTQTSVDLHKYTYSRTKSTHRQKVSIYTCGHCLLSGHNTGQFRVRLPDCKFANLGGAQVHKK